MTRFASVDRAHWGGGRSTVFAPVVAAALAASCLAIPLPILAQDVDLSFGAQVRPRFEYRDPTPLDSHSFVSMRVRANLEASLPEGVGIFVQLQDVRLWGLGGQHAR